MLIELVEPDDFPRDQPRMVINRYLEAFYNARAPRNTYVPYGFWERGGTRSCPTPRSGDVGGRRGGRARGDAAASCSRNWRD